MTHAQRSGQSSLLLLDVISILNRNHIPYAVIGAFAASFYGVIRGSTDADAMISMPSGQTDIETLIHELQKPGFKTTYRTGELRDPIGAVIKVEDQFGNRVDLLMNIEGVSEAAFSRAIDSNFMDQKIRIVGLEDFIAMKILAGNPTDLSDAAGALKVSGKKLNRALLRKLVRGYGKGALHRLESLLKASS